MNWLLDMIESGASVFDVVEPCWWTPAVREEQRCSSHSHHCLAPGSLSSEAQAERQAVRGEAQSAREARPEEEGSRALGRRCRQTPEQRRHRAGGGAADQDDDNVQEPTGRCHWFLFAYVYC